MVLAGEHWTPAKPRPGYEFLLDNPFHFFADRVLAAVCLSLVAKADKIEQDSPGG